MHKNNLGNVSQLGSKFRQKWTGATHTVALWLERRKGGRIHREEWRRRKRFKEPIVSFFSHLETRKTRCLEEKKTLSPNNKDATNLASGLERKNRGVAAGNGRAEAMPTIGAIQWSCAKCLQIRCLTRRLGGTILPGVLQQNIFKVPNSAKFILLMFPSISRQVKIAECRLKYPVRIFYTWHTLSDAPWWPLPDKHKRWTISERSSTFHC